MLHRVTTGLFAIFLFAANIMSPAQAQNLFPGGDFETPVMPHVGDNIIAIPPSWAASSQWSQTAQSYVFVPISIVRVEGPLGTVPTTTTGFSGGNALLQALPRSDASNTPAGQYARPVQRVGAAWLYGKRIEMPSDGCVKFSGKFSNATAAGGHAALFITELSPAWLAQVQANPNTMDQNPRFGGNTDPGAHHKQEYFNFTTPYEVWNEYAIRSQVEAGKTYSFAFNLAGGNAVDDITLEYVAIEQCDLNWVPPIITFDPADINLTKTCTPAHSHAINGEVGQLWNCAVDVTVPDAPFAGSLSVTDAYTSISTTAANVISSSSGSGNFDCTSGATCTIDGADFDISGTETLAYSIFVTATELQDSYPMQNCVEGSYDDATGTITPIGGNCVPAQWIPRTSVSKTCDPITPVSSGLMTLNCQIEMTGTNLATNSFILAADAFAALPPVNATITGPMMNVTSNEPWSCIDGPQNAPGSIGLCELSAADMLAAGGTSTLNVSFDFTADQSSGQVVNCPMTDILPTSFVAAVGQRRSQPQVRSPQTNSVAGLPDNCVIVDLPKVTPPPKIEKVELKKTCEAPAPATIQGVFGYTWDCRAEISVIPTPFAGSFTLDDDASGISIGAAQFMSASEPACTGIGTDQLQCILDGNTMTAPHVVSYQLFTEVVDPNQPIEWENCAKGFAETAAGQTPADLHCVSTVIKPEVIKDPDPKEITVEKSCGRAFDETFDGATGMGWNCEIKVTANPAPFAGSFTFTEDASTVAGSSNANIVDIIQQTNGWNCTPNVPTQSTDCTISGSNFDPSGIEIIGFHLFAETGKEPVKWRNCVSGVYTSLSGEEHGIKGNCEETTWKPSVISSTPTFSLKKGCSAPTAFGNGQRYICTIFVTQTGGGPITAPLTMDELFTNMAGTPATQYLMMLSGSAGWQCDMAIASCTIPSAQFNGVTGHQITGIFLIPNAVLAEQDFKNCAELTLNGKPVASADCLNIDEPNAEFDVEKTCKATGERMVLSHTGWVQPYQCTLTVTSDGQPFTGPLWITEDLHFGTNPAENLIQNITSNDPWDCSSPPYSTTGQGNAPYCGIQGSQFPASGSSTLTVDLMMNATMDQFGAENCVSIALGEPTAAGLPAPIASDCFEIAPTLEPKEPKMELVKTCGSAVRDAAGIWTAECEITVTVENMPLPPVYTSIRFFDELAGSGPQTPLTSLMPLSNGNSSYGPNTGTPPGINRARTKVHMFAPNGTGSITLPYTATFSGPAGNALNGSNIENCAWAEIPSLNLRAPAGPLGTEKYCVPINFPLSAVVGPDIGVIGGPVTPTRPIDSILTHIDPSIAVDPIIPPGCGFDTLFLIDRSGSMNLHNRLPLTKQALIAALRIFEGGGSKSGAIIFNQSAYVIGGPSTVLPSPALEAAIVAINAAGNEDWQVGMSATNTAVSGITDKPLVLFIADGVPGKPFNGNAAQNINAAAPALNALRNQGSRVVGVALGYTSVASGLSTLLGPNLVTAGGNVAIDPLTTDVIHIPESSQIIPAFEAIARAYCPERKGMTQPQKDALMAVMQAVPKSADAYMGDDEELAPLEQDAVVQPPILSIQSPTLTITKEQTGPCDANRASQTYDCGFRLSVTNTGTGPYIGPLVMTDTAGNPGIKSATAVSGNGWSCGAVVQNAVSCTNAAVNLTPGASTHVDLRMKVKGLRGGGSINNCATTGVTDDRRQRVALVQKIMNDRGLEAGPVDGDSGNKTYAALAKLQAALGLPISRAFDDALFKALGLPLQAAGQASCVMADLAPMPAPPLQCNAKTTVSKGESCACRYDNMERRNATSCGCGDGQQLIKGKGCQAVPKPAPDVAPLKCERASSRLRGNQCVCIDQRNAKRVSPTQCRCTNGLPMVNGRCIPVVLKPTPDKPRPKPTDDVTGERKCRLEVNGICLKR